MGIDLAATVARLQADVSRYASSSRAAGALRKAALEGADLSPWRDELTTALCDATQMGIVEPLAAALVVHALRWHDTDLVASLLKRKSIALWVSDALIDAAEKRVDVSRILGFLLDTPGLSLDLGRLVGAYVGGRGDRAAEMVDRLLPRRGEFAARWLWSQVLENRRPDYSEAVYRLAPLLQARSRKAREQAAGTFCLAAERGMDLDPVADDLVRALEDPDAEVAHRAAYALGLARIGRSDWEGLDRLPKRRRAVRLGLRRSLAVALCGDGDDRVEVVSRLARCALDRHREVRERTVTALEEARRKGRTLRVDPQTLDDLAAGLSSASLRGALAACLFYLVETSGEAAAQVARSLEGRRHPRLEALRESCRRVMAGNRPTCPICLGLPRHKSYDRESDLPPEFSRLVEEGPLHRCPECRAVYLYRYEQEWEDMSFWESHEIRRLAPAQALERGCWDRERFEEALREGRLNLDHPLAKLREDAAWALALQALEESDWTSLEGLLDHRAREVRLQTLRTVEAAECSAEPLLAPLRRLLEDREDLVARAAARILGGHYLERDEVEPLCALLRSSSAEVAGEALAVLARSPKERSLAPFLSTLDELADHPDDSLRRYALTVRDRIPRKPSLAEVEQWASALADPDPGSRSEAAERLGALARAGADLGPALPALAKGLVDPEGARYHARKTLALAISQGIDVGPILPALGEALRRDPDPDLLYLVEQAARSRADVAALLPSLAPLAASHDEALLYPVEEILSLLFSQGVDLEEALPYLHQGVHSDDGYSRERFTMLLTRYYGRRGRWDEILGLYRVKRTGVAWAVADTVEEEGLDLGPMLGALAGSLAGNDELLRDKAARLLRQALEEDPHRAEHEEVRKVLGLLGLPEPEPVEAGPLPRSAEPPPGFEGLTWIALPDLDPPRRVGLLEPFNKEDPARFLPDLYRQVEELGRLHSRPVRLISYATADHLLQKADQYPRLLPYGPFLTDALIGYEAPHQPLGSEIVFAHEGQPSFCLKTGSHAGKVRALVILGLRAEDFREEGDRVVVEVAEERLLPLDDFPGGGWRQPDPATGLPTGWRDTVSDEGRKLWRLPDRYVGPVGRGLQFGGFPIDDVRHVLAGNFGLRDHYGVLVEV